MVLAASAVAQDPEPVETEAPFVGSVQVSVVNVDVYVTDREGNPVTGLSAADFEVKEDGKPVEITNFYAVERGRPAGPRPDPEDAAQPADDRASAPEPLPWEQELPRDQRLRLVVFVDNFNLRPLERNRILGSLRTFLLTQLGPQDEVMLVSDDRALNVRHPFTRDLGAVADSLLELSETSGFRVPRDNDRREALRGVEEATSASEALNWARNYAESQFDELSATVSSLREFLDSIAGLPGRKVLLHVSSGIPMVPGQEVFEAIDVKFQDSQAFMEMARYDGSHLFERLAVQANAHRISFYMVDAGGLRPDVFGGAEYRGSSSPTSRTRVGSAAEANLQSSLHYLADRSGGRAIVNVNDVLQPLRQVGASLQSYYSLGYNERSVGDGRYHRITVKVRRPGVDVRHRDGYRSLSRQDRMADRVRAALSYTYEENPLHIDAQPGDGMQQSDGQYVVPLTIRIPVDQIVLFPQADGRHEAHLQLFVAAIDDRGRSSAVETVPLGFRLDAEQVDAARGESYVYTHRLLMRAGQQKLALAVLDEIGARYSVLSLRVQTGQSG